MSISNGYITLVEAKLDQQIDDSADDTAVEEAVETASRLIDEFCGPGRRFYADDSATAKTFRANPDDGSRLWLPDFHSTDGLIVETDTTNDGTFDTTWDASDYQVEPLNPEDGYPFTSLVAVDAKTWPTGGPRARVRITAKWGWENVPTRVKDACAIQAGVIFKRRTEGAAPITTIDGTTLHASRYMDRQAQLLLYGLQRLEVSGI